MSYPVLFDGHCLSDLFTVEYHMERALPKWQPNVIEAPASTGALFGGTQPQPVEITMELYTFDKTRDERQEALRTLAGWLAVDSPRVLQLGDEGGRYRYAIPTDNAPIEAFLNAERVEVTFICPDPRLYGKERTVTVPAGGSATFVVGGTAPTMPTIYTEVMASGANQYWRLGLEDGTYILYQPLHYAPGVLYIDKLTIDCERRTVRSWDETKMLPPTSDWLTLPPGEHTLTMTTDGDPEDATVTYREMWW